MTVLYRNNLNPFDVLDFLVKDLTQNHSYYTSIASKDYKSAYPYDMYENKDESVTIEIAAIGLDKSEIKIEIDQDNLRAYSTKKEEDKKEYIFKKIAKRNFDLSWIIPKDYDPKGITSKLDKGSLFINIPLSKESKNNKFDVKID